MNLRKLTLLILFSIAVFPAITSAHATQKDPVVHQTVRRGSISRYFHRLVTLGRPSR
jgi:hypothetical protein